MDNIYLVSYINLFDKIYAITINDQKQINFLESRLTDNDKRIYSQPTLDKNIINKTREQIVDINKNLLIQALTDYLNDKMTKGLYKDKNDLLTDINQFKGYINSDPKLKDFLYFQDALEQIKFDNNIAQMLEHFDKTFIKEQKNKETIKQQVQESIDANDIVEATLDNGTKVAVDMHHAKDNNETKVIQLRPNENLASVLSEQPMVQTYTNAADVLHTMANTTHLSAIANSPTSDNDKDLSLASQVALNKNKYENNLDIIAINGDNNLTNDNIVINKQTGEVSEVSTMNDGSIYLNGTTQNNISSNGIESYQTQDSSFVPDSQKLNVEEQEILDDPTVMQEFDELEALYNDDKKEEWTNKVEYLYETNRDKWEEYMAYHDAKQSELNKNKAPQKNLGTDPRAAFIDISIIALITSIIGTSTLLAILINLM